MFNVLKERKLTWKIFVNCKGKKLAVNRKKPKSWFLSGCIFCWLSHAHVLLPLNYPWGENMACSNSTQLRRSHKLLGNFLVTFLISFYRNLCTFNNYIFKYDNI